MILRYYFIYFRLSCCISAWLSNTSFTFAIMMLAGFKWFPTFFQPFFAPLPCSPYAVMQFRLQDCPKSKDAFQIIWNVVQWNIVLFVIKVCHVDLSLLCVIGDRHQNISFWIDNDWNYFSKRSIFQQFHCQSAVLVLFETLILPLGEYSVVGFHCFKKKVSSIVVQNVIANIIVNRKPIITATVLRFYSTHKLLLQ